MNKIKLFESTLDIVMRTKECYRKMSSCLGDSGDIKCFFCPFCVLSIDERISNLQLFELQVYNEGNKIN